MHDLRVSGRLLWKHKTFTLTAALTLAVCIGTNVALFTVVDHVLLRPLRVPESDRVVLVYNSYPKAGADHAAATVVDYIERGRELTVFDEQALFNVRNPSLDLNGDARAHPHHAGDPVVLPPDSRTAPDRARLHRRRRSAGEASRRHSERRSSPRGWRLAPAAGGSSDSS